MMATKNFCPRGAILQHAAELCNVGIIDYYTAMQMSVPTLPTPVQFSCRPSDGASMHFSWKLVIKCINYGGST